MRSPARGSAPIERPRSPSTMPTVASSGKLWPLATICVPMMMSISPALDLADDLAHLGEARDEIGREKREARLGKALGDLLGDALDARSAGHERAFLAALRALLRDRQREAAVVAVQAMAEAVLDQPRRALRALEAVAAAAAQRERRVAAAVEKQQRLLALRRAFRPGVDEHRRQPAAFLRRVLAQVDGRDLRHLDAGEARPAARRGGSGRCAR